MNTASTGSNETASLTSKTTRPKAGEIATLATGERENSGVRIHRRYSRFAVFSLSRGQILSAEALPFGACEPVYAEAAADALRARREAAATAGDGGTMRSFASILGVRFWVEMGGVRRHAFRPCASWQALDHTSPDVFTLGEGGEGGEDGTIAQPLFVAAVIRPVAPSSLFPAGWLDAAALWSISSGYPMLPKGMTATVGDLTRHAPALVLVPVGTPQRRRTADITLQYALALGEALLLERQG